MHPGRERAQPYVRSRETDKLETPKNLQAPRALRLFPELRRVPTQTPGGAGIHRRPFVKFWLIPHQQHLSEILPLLLGA